MNRKKVIGLAALLLIIAIIVGGYVAFDHIFPKAPPIRLPEQDNIVSVIVTFSDGKVETVLDEEDVATLLSLLTNAERTRKQCIDDLPTVRPFYQIEIKTSEREYRYFIYKEASGQIYIELPYEGAYAGDEKVLSFIQGL